MVCYLFIFPIKQKQNSFADCRTIERLASATMKQRSKTVYNPPLYTYEQVDYYTDYTNNTPLILL